MRDGIHERYGRELHIVSAGLLRPLKQVLSSAATILIRDGELELNPAVFAAEVEAFWLDARHLMNDLSDRCGAALVVAAPAGSGFVVIAADDLLECERVAGRREILDSRVCC
jgi:hypothetical protein